MLDFLLGREISFTGKVLVEGVDGKKGREKCHQEPRIQKSVGKLVHIRHWWGGGQRREGATAKPLGSVHIDQEPQRQGTSCSFSCSV